MYFYGTFHKINTDFLNPASSCAVAFWHRYGFPAWLDQSPFVHALNMYGTLVLEAVIIFMLLSQRFRWLGIVLGVSFHAFLAFQPDGWFRAFSILSIALHSLFLPPDILSRFAAAPRGRRLLKFFAPTGRRVLYGTLALLAGWAIYALWRRSRDRDLSLLRGVLLAFGVAGSILWMIIDFGLIDPSNQTTLSWVMLTLLAAVLTAGMSWSHLRRRWSGQVDIDDIDEEKP